MVRQINVKAEYLIKCLTVAFVSLHIFVFRNSTETQGEQNGD